MNVSYSILYRTLSVCIALVLSLAVLVPTLARAETPDLRVHEGDQVAEFESNEVIFRLRNDSERFRVMHVPDVRAAVESLRRNPRIEYAEPNYVATAYATPNDPYYAYQWHFDNNTYGGVHAESAWDTTRGAGTVVAVIDTGVAYEDHSTGGRGPFGETFYQAPDLADTCFVSGYDFINGDKHPNDDNAHGTHVAGTIAQSTDNGEGVAGLAYETCIMPVKVLDQNGAGTYSEVADGIYYAADNGADVINLSLGGSVDSTTLRDAVAYAHSKGVTVVAAAGNSGGAVGYPAAYDEYVIAVGATRFDEARASYSNYGAALDLVAPGGDLSVDQNGDGYPDGVLQQTFDPGTHNTGSFNYYFFEGTSMAAPHAAAAAAMVLGHGNATTPDEVRTALESTADDLGESGRDDHFGYGIINIPAALAWTSGSVDSVPSVDVTAPNDGEVVSGDVLVTASASDDDAVTEVQFYVDDTLIGTDTSSPYEATWNSTDSSDGSHTISATAVDTASQSTSDSVAVTVDNVNEAPSANAGPDQSAYVDETVTFDGSGSSDDRGISMYEWDFGDGASAVGESVSHAYSAADTYTVTLTVTDTDGVADTDEAVVTVEAEPTEPITLSVSGYKERGRHKADLTWSGATSDVVDVYRDGRLITTTANDGTYTDNIDRRGRGSYDYQVCESGTDTCSSVVSLTFG